MLSDHTGTGGRVRCLIIGYRGLQGVTLLPVPGHRVRFLTMEYWYGRLSNITGTVPDHLGYRGECYRYLTIGYGVVPVMLSDHTGTSGRLRYLIIGYRGRG